MTTNNNGQKEQISARTQRQQKRLKGNNVSKANNKDGKEAPEEEIAFTPVDMTPPEGQESSDNEMEISDDITVRGGSSQRTPIIEHTRCTLKLKITGGKNAFGRSLALVREVFTQLKKFDKWAGILPWYENVVRGVEEITTPADIMMDHNAITSYLPRFMNRKVKGTTQYESMFRLKSDIRLISMTSFWI